VGREGKRGGIEVGGEGEGRRRNDQGRIREGRKEGRGKRHDKVKAKAKGKRRKCERENERDRYQSKRTNTKKISFDQRACAMPTWWLDRHFQSHRSLFLQLVLQPLQD